MRLNYSLVVAVAVATTAIFGPVMVSALGQTTLPPDVVVANPPFTPQQQKQIDDYAEHWIQQLASGDQEQIKEARTRIMDPLLLPGISDEFKKRYTIAVLSRLQRVVIAQHADPGVAAGTDIVTQRRVNAMIILTRLQGDGVLELIAAGLTDHSPAVRYWAAKAVARIAEHDGLSDVEQRQVLVLLDTALGDETSSLVLAELLNALNALEITGAKKVLLSALNTRVLFHAKHPEVLYLPEYNAMQKFYLEMVRRRAGNEAVEGQIRELARVAFRYMALAAEQLNKGDALEADVQKDHRVMVSLGDTILRFAVPALEPTWRLPEQIDNAVNFGDWAFVLVHIHQWKELLHGPPFSLSDQELNISAPEVPNNGQASNGDKQN